MMLPQRARGAESRVKNKSSNGPLRAQSNAGDGRVFCDVWAYVSCRGYVGILLSARRLPGIKVAPRIKYYSSLAEGNFCQGLFVF